MRLIFSSLMCDLYNYLTCLTATICICPAAMVMAFYESAQTNIQITSIVKQPILLNPDQLK